MPPAFVYPAHRFHVPYRQLARDHDMAFDNSVLFHKPRNVSASIVFPDYAALGGKPQFMKSQEAIDRWFWHHGGVNLCYSALDIERGIRPGGPRLRSPVHSVYSSVAQAFESIGFGVGLFRDAQTRQRPGFCCMIGTPALPKVVSVHQTVLLHHNLFFRGANTKLPGIVDRKIYESTNLILADSYGELEQIMRRRHELSFLNAYLKELLRSASYRRDSDSRLFTRLRCPAFIDDYGDEIIRAWLKHITLGIWKELPKTVAELIERAAYLLENTLIDDNPREVITSHEHLQLWDPDSVPPTPERTLHLVKD